METYIVLANLTDHGIRSVKETTRRADAFRDLAKTFGINVKENLLDTWPLRYHHHD